MPYFFILQSNTVAQSKRQKNVLLAQWDVMFLKHSGAEENLAQNSWLKLLIGVMIQKHIRSYVLTVKSTYFYAV